MFYQPFAIATDIWANIIGSFIAVLGAICVLFLSEWWRKKIQNNKIEKNFLSELKYLRAIISECKKSLERMIEQLGVGTTTLYFDYKSTDILSKSSQEAYEEGLLYERLSPEQIAKFNSDVLTFFGNTTIPIENFVGDAIREWQGGRKTTQDLYGVLVWAKDKAEEAIKLLKKIESDFQKKQKRQ